MPITALEWKWVALIEVGAIPDAIASCSSIRLLHLRKNQLSGAIPGCMSAIDQDMSEIELDQNKLSGTIPSAFSSLLWSLWLDDNELSGSVPDVEVVGAFSAPRNKLTGTLPRLRSSSLRLLYLKGSLTREHAAAQRTHQSG